MTDNLDEKIKNSQIGNKEIMAENMDRLMKKKNIGRQELANLINVKYSSIADWLNGNYYPRWDSIVKMAEVFDVDTEVLIEKYDEDNDGYLKDLEKKVKIPVLGSIPAGVPLEMVPDSLKVDYEEIPKSWLKGNKQFFALRISGDSMMDKYHDGDNVVFLKTPECSASGEDCCVRIGMDEATFKHVTYNKEGLTLTPLNPENSSGFKEQTYSWDQVGFLNIVILGVVRKHTNFVKK